MNSGRSALMFVHVRAAALAGTAVAAFSLPAVAQTQGAGVQPNANIGANTSSPTSPPTSSVLNEVIVTAQRRSENLERTPVAVSVLSADTLTKANITTQSDLQIAAPGLLVRQSTNSNEINFAIRGQSLDPYSSTRPGVLPYLNDVQVGGASSTSIYDLQSVQVLKGPQGTLFGRSATGGAVLYTTAKPTNTFGGYISAAGGNYDTGQLEGALNVPLFSDKLLTRLSGFAQTNSGYQDNLYNGQKLGGAERFAGRLSLSAHPIERLKNDLVIDYYHARGRNLTAVLSSLNANSPVPVDTLYSNAVFPPGSGPLTGTSVSDYVLSQILTAEGLPPATAAALSKGNYARYIASLNSPYAPAGGLAAVLAQQSARGPYEVAIRNPNNFRSENVIVTNTTTYDLASNLQVKNILGYTNLRFFTNVNTDGTVFEISDDGNNSKIGNPTDENQLSDEIQLNGKALANNLQYVAGFYYDKENTTIRQAAQFFDILLGGETQEFDALRQNTTYAAYSQGTYDLTSLTDIRGLSATAGLRYTNERVGNIILPTNDFYDLALMDPTVYNNNQSRTFDNVGYTVGLQDQLTSDMLVYIDSRRSFKDGGFNYVVAPKVGFGDTAGNAYKTETVTDVEVGSKFQGRLAGLPMRLNGDLYYDWIDNNQRAAYVSVAGSPAAVTVNVPEAKVYGFEFDGQVSPTPWLRVGLTSNYTFARFTQGETAVAGTTQLLATYPDTPRWSGAAYADASFPLSERLTGTLHGDIFAQSRTFDSSAENLDPGADIPGYMLANFRVGLEDSQSNSTLTANIKNAFDKVYYTGGLPLGPLLGINTRVPGLPLTFLIEARHTF